MTSLPSRLWSRLSERIAAHEPVSQEWFCKMVETENAVTSLGMNAIAGAVAASRVPPINPDALRKAGIDLAKAGSGSSDPSHD